MKTRTVLIIGLLALTGFGLWYVLQDERPVTNYPPSTHVVVALGDSLTEGIGANTGNDYVAVLERILEIEIVNEGRSGDTTEDGLRRLEDDVLSRNPGIVLVLLGGNDYLRRIPRETTFSNLATIIDRIHKRGAVVLLLGVRGGLFGDSYADDYEKLAREKGVAFIPNVLEGILGDQNVMYDSIHPNDQGYERIAHRIAPVLERLMR